LRAQLAVLDSAIAILSPGWKPPTGPVRRRPVKVKEGASGAVARADVAGESVRMLKQARTPMTTTEIAEVIAKAHGVPFTDRADRKRLTSGVLSALRRFQKKGLAVVHQGDKRELRWSVRRLAAGAA
jgi:hypothetical protein